MKSVNIFLYGKVPPPINGQAICNYELLRVLKIKHCNSRILFVSRNSNFDNIRFFRIFSELYCFLRLVFFSFKCNYSRLIISCASGFGGYFDLLILFVFLFKPRSTVFLWYHSRLKASGQSFSQKLIDFFCIRFSFCLNVKHLVLDDFQLRSRLRCGIDYSDIIVLNNSYIFINKHPSLSLPRPSSVPSKSSFLSLGYFSKLSHEKGFPVFVETIFCIRKKYPYLPLNILIAGKNESPDLLNELLALNSFPHLSVVYFGILDRDKYDLFYSKIHFLLFPSSYKHEASPLTLLEAVFSGVVPFATPIGGIAEILKNPYVELTEVSDSFPIRFLSLIENEFLYDHISSSLWNSLTSNMSSASTVIESF